MIKSFLLACMLLASALAHADRLTQMNHTELCVYTTQLQVAAYVSLRIFDYGYMIALAFFGCFCLIIGYLVLRSTFFPRLVGPFLVIEGALYLTNSFAHFVAPAVGARVFPFLAVSGIAEVSFCLCLLVVGVNARRWNEQAAWSSRRSVPA